MDGYGNNCCLLGIFCTSEYCILLALVESHVLSCTSSKKKSNILEHSCLFIRKWRHGLFGIALCSEWVQLIIWNGFVTFNCVRASSHQTVLVLRLVHSVISVLFSFSGGKIYFLFRRRWCDIVRTTPVPPPSTMASESPWETLGSCRVIQFSNA
jgi:hypothetical protein